MRVAVIDIGSNSTRLLIADVEDGRVTEIERRSNVTRLGQGVDGSANLHEDAIARVLSTLDQYAGLMHEQEVQRARAVMTSAVRDSSNGEQFRSRVAEQYELDARILSGDEEAQLTYAGAFSERPPDDDKTHAVIDIGGGSTEFVIGTGHVASLHRSTQVGVVRYSERHLHHDPPEAAELHSLQTAAGEVFAATLPQAARADVTDAIAVAGTATSCAAIAQKLEPYDPAKVEGYRLTMGEIEMLIAKLAGMNNDQRRALPGLHPDRAPTIVAGAILLAEALRVFGLQSAEVSEHDILRGVALELAE